MQHKPTAATLRDIYCVDPHVEHLVGQLYMLNVNRWAQGMFPSGQFQPSLSCYPLMKRKRYDIDKRNIVKTYVVYVAKFFFTVETELRI